MRRPKKAHKYPTDTEAGIRKITQIRALPSGQLTDEEFCKAFFDRFKAEALILTYLDEDGIHCFGRLKHGAAAMAYYRGLKRELDLAFERANVREIEERPVVAGISILQNMRTNYTFIATDLDEKAQTGTRDNDQHIIRIGELTI